MSHITQQIIIIIAEVVYCYVVHFLNKIDIKFPMEFYIKSLPKSNDIALLSNVDILWKYHHFPHG